jgi:hypothetical protein
MKWALYAVGGLAVLVGIAAGIGAMLPVKHHASRKARYQVAPEALFAVLSGPPDWRSGLKSYGELPAENGRRRWYEEDKWGDKMTFELVESRAPARMVVRIADQGAPFGGTWTFDVSPAAGGSEVRIAEDGEIYNVIFRFVARYFYGYHRSIESFLKDLGAKFGQRVEIER